MGCSREGFNLFNKFGREAFFRTWNWRMMCVDTFPQFLCWIIGHNYYDCSDIGDKPEWACKRCHQYKGR